MGEVLETDAWATRLVRTPQGLRVRSAADPFVEAMHRRRRLSDKIFLAARAIRRDPDNIEANLFLAEHSKTNTARIAHLLAAVEEGERLWNGPGVRIITGPDLADVPAARPFLESLLELGSAFEETGDRLTARDQFQRLLELNPSDVFDARRRIELLVWACPALAV